MNNYIPCPAVPECGGSTLHEWLDYARQVACRLNYFPGSILCTVCGEAANFRPRRPPLEKAARQLNALALSDPEPLGEKAEAHLYNLADWLDAIERPELGRVVSSLAQGNYSEALTETRDILARCPAPDTLSSPYRGDATGLELSGILAGPNEFYAPGEALAYRMGYSCGSVCALLLDTVLKNDPRDQCEDLLAALSFLHQQQELGVSEALDSVSLQMIDRYSAALYQAGETAVAIALTCLGRNKFGTASDCIFKRIRIANENRSCLEQIAAPDIPSL